MSFFKKIRVKWRLLFGFCPKCNSDAPDLYDCDICNWYRTSESGMPSKETKKLWWEKYLHLLTLLLVITTIFYSCEPTEPKKVIIYSLQDKLSFKGGDTVYLKYAGVMTLGVVLKNDVKFQVITLWRKNIYGDDCRQLEVWNYNDLP